MIAMMYLDFVKDELTQTVPANMITIMGVYPSPLDDDDVIKYVCKNWSVREDQVHLLDDKMDLSNDARRARALCFNSYLKEGCSKRGLFYDDIYEEMMDPSTNLMRDSFRTITPINMHDIVWETTIQLWMERWPWLRELAPPDFDERLRRTLAKYVRAVQRRQTTKIQFFGDSFIRIFSLVESPYINVKAFKGGSAKGIGRATNDNRRAIVNHVHDTQPTRLVFCFGSVDVHLSYFHARVKGETVDLAMIAKAYLDFVNDELTEFVPANMINIVGVYPSPLNDDVVRESVSNYGSVPRDQVHLLDDERDLSNDARQGRVQLFNSHLKEGCSKHGFAYDDMYEQMMDPATNQMRDSFRDVSSHNIHIVWETTMLLWMERWPWLRELAPRGFEEGLQRTLEKYLRTKPWAEKTHVASTLGVRGAFDQANGNAQNHSYKQESR
jgi:hypothetical protein